MVSLQFGSMITKKELSQAVYRFAEALEKIKKERELSYAELAEILQIERANVIRIIVDKDVNVSLTTIVCASKNLGVKVSDLIDID
jgi:DNA-binding Xre family transcriptional regulator